MYSRLFKDHSLASSSYGEVSFGPFLLILPNIDKDRIVIGVILIRVGTVEDDGEFYEGVALNRVALIAFDICDSVKDGVSLCRLILDLERYSPW